MLKKIFAAMILTMFLLIGDAGAQVSYQQVRNATGILSYNNVRFLIDPMLAEKDRYEGFAGTFNSEIRNPMIELPFAKEQVMQNIDAVIVTHTHLDHWDEVAQQFINKSIQIFVQDDKDLSDIKKQGFKNVKVLDANTKFRGVTLTKVEGTHGTVEMYANPEFNKVAGESMGIVFTMSGEKTAYVIGDTIWTARVSKTLHNFKPEILIMNTGYAKTLHFNESIIMGTEDVAKAAQFLPQSKIVAVHMDAINHCTVSRKHMREFVSIMHLTDRVFIPNDGETINF